MGSFSIEETMINLREQSKLKTETRFLKLFILGIMAGAFISFGAVAAHTASFGVSNPSLSKFLMSAIFPGGLFLCAVTSAELFTGNVLRSIGVFERVITIPKLIKNWIIVYIANFIGSVAIAYATIFFGQADYGNGKLAIHYINTASYKVGLDFTNALVLGMLCNILVCFAVISLTKSKDNAGKLAGLYLPIFLFVISGFEHSVANMFYVPAGIFANSVNRFHDLAIMENIDVSNLTWGNFFSNNLLPVTLGNIIGGLLVVLFMWGAYRKDMKK